MNRSGSECLLRMITVAKVAGEDSCELVDMCRAGGCMSGKMEDRCLSKKKSNMWVRESGIKECWLRIKAGLMWSIWCI